MLIIGHRGAMGSQEENTIPSFDKAIQQEADYIELDLMLTSDNIPIVFHDENLLRMTGENKLVKDLALFQIDSLVTKRGNDIISFRDFLNLYAGKNMKWNFELKSNGNPEKVATKAIPIFSQFVNRGLYYWSDVIFSSFKLSELFIASHLASHIRLGLLREKLYLLEELNLYKLDFIDFIILDFKNVNREIVDRLHYQGKDVWCYTVNGVTSISKMIEANVDGIITDYPALSRESYRSLIINFVRRYT